LVNGKTIRSAAVFQGVSIADHVAATISGELRRKGSSAVALLAILETSNTISSVVAGIQAQLHGHGSRSTSHSHTVGDGTSSNGIYIASY
jgi:hypothetical protein